MLVLSKLKIFISSTFNDMYDERQKLTTDVFLKFRKLAKQRGVEVTEIELRTGVTDATGHIAKVCLELVDNCKESPIFFLGILGDYYGWDEWYEVEEKESLKDKHRAIMDKYSNISITELEIRYAIDNPSHNKALFYATKPTENEDKRLVSLKNELKEYAKERDNLQFDYYESDEDFAQKVYEDLETAFNKIYPPSEKELSEVEQLRASHEAFALSRYKSYVKYDKNEKILDDFLSSKHEDRLLLYGKSGYGKSALIANYFKRFRKENDAFVIEHYIGGAGELSNDFYAMLQRVMLEIKEEFNIDDNVPTEQEAILNEFVIWLQKVKRQTIIVFDGYNQIEDEIKKRFLKFFLSVKFENVKLIVTSIKSNYAIENKREISKLNRKKQKELIDKYLGIYGKKLTYDVDVLLKHDVLENTLFLRTLLEEIRLLGVYETIGQDIAEYLTSKSLEELFVKIFRRYERDYDAIITKEVLSLLYVSRDGLSQNNLLEILEQTREIDRYKFYPLILALEEHLINSGGMYQFFHDYIKMAVKSRYLISQNNVKLYRNKIINFFKLKDNMDSQKIRELPFQLFKLEKKKKLYKLLIDYDFFAFLLEKNQYELLKYINYVNNPNFSKKLTKKLLSFEEDIDIINNIGIFFDIVYIDKNSALKLYKQSLFLYQKFYSYTKHEDIATSYNNIASAYQSINNYKKAEKFFLKAISNNSSNNNEVAIMIYNNLAGYYMDIGKLKLAFKYYRKSLYLRKQNDSNPIDLSIVYNNLGEYYTLLGKYKTALFFHQKSLILRKKHLNKNHPYISITYNNLGLAYENLGYYDKALDCFNKAIEINLNTYGKNHDDLATTYVNKANILHRIKNKVKESLSLHKKALSITINTYGKKHLNTAISYNDIAGVYNTLNQYKKSLYYYTKSLKIKKKLFDKNHPLIAESYNNLAVFHYYNNEPKKAHQYILKAIEIWGKSFSDNHPNLVGARESLEMIEKEL